MKNRTAIQNWSLLLLMALSTAFIPVDTLENRDDCRLNVQRTVTFGLHQSVNPSGISTSSQDPAEMTPGMLELCVDNEGICTWIFSGQPQIEHLVQVPALEPLIQMVFTSAMTIDDYITTVRKKGASITDLGNHTLSITDEDKIKGLTIITLVDMNRKVILGSNIYQNRRELTTKVICQYDGKNSNPQLQALSLLIWKGDALTEMVFKNF